MDFTMFSGNAKVLEFTVYDKPGGDVVTLVGATAIKWQLFHMTPATADPIISKTLGSGITVTSPAGGIYEVVLAAVDTTSLAGLYYYETELVDADGYKETVDSGTINIKQRRIA